MGEKKKITKNKLSAILLFFAVDEYFKKGEDSDGFANTGIQSILS